VTGFDIVKEEFLSFISTRKRPLLFILILLSGCAGRAPSPEGTLARVSRAAPGPCPEFFLYSEDRTRIEGVLLAGSALPFSLKIGQDRRSPGALRDASEVLQVLDAWQVEGCKEGLKMSPSERARRQEESERITRHLKAFVLIVTMPYGSEEEAAREIKSWVDGVRTDLLRGLQRRGR
jgi:hypothetical protein